MRRRCRWSSRGRQSLTTFPFCPCTTLPYFVYITTRMILSIFIGRRSTSSRFSCTRCLQSSRLGSGLGLGLGLVLYFSHLFSSQTPHLPIVISLCLTGCLKKIEKQIELGRFYLEKTHSRAVSFEEQVSLVRESLAKAFEAKEEWTEAAKMLAVDLSPSHPPPPPPPPPPPLNPRPYPPPLPPYPPLTPLTPP